MNGRERDSGLSSTSLRVMNLYFGLSEVRRNKAISIVGWEPLAFLSEVDKAFLGYPDKEPKFGPFTFQVHHKVDSFWVGISLDGRRIRFSEEDDKKLIYHEWRTSDGEWARQDPKECYGQDAIEFEKALEGLVSNVEAKLKPQKD